MSKLLTTEDFISVIRHSPLIAIDFIVKNDQEEYLLGYRRNSPAKNTWFVPGGRIRKNETFENAFKRISRAELGQELHLTDHKFYGVYEHFYANENTFDLPGLDTHYINLAYEITDFDLSKFDLAAQHSDFKWMSLTTIHSDPQVHPNARAYFKQRVRSKE